MADEEKLAMPQGIYRALGVAGILGIVGLGPAAAASTFEAGVVDAGSPACVLGTSPASGSFSSATGSSSASASSVGGILSGSASATTTGVASAFSSNAASFCASAIIDDLIISGPASEASVQISADLFGLLNLLGANETDSTTVLEATLQIFLPLVASSPLAAFSLNLGAPQDDTSIESILETPAVTLPTDTNLMVELSLDGQVLARDNFSPGSATASLDGLTLSFPTMGPVLTLPAGFTADSVSGNIVDNQFVVVPEPEAAALLLTGLGVFGGVLGVRRGRRHRAPPTPRRRLDD